MKMSTKQAIRESLKKKKGKKSNKSKGLDASNSNKPNDSNKIGIKGKRGREKPVVPNNVTTRNDSECQVTLPVLPEILDTKAKMSDKELRFIYFYMAGGITVERAMILAGYSGYSETYLKKLGTQLIAKHECQVGDHRKIFRAVGAGETAIAMGLLHLAQNARSEMVRHNAWNSLSKCMGLSKEVMETAEGIQIIINRGCVTAGEDDQPAVLDLPKAPPPSSGTLQITK